MLYLTMSLPFMCDAHACARVRPSRIKQWLPVPATSCLTYPFIPRIEHWRRGWDVMNSFLKIQGTYRTSCCVNTTSVL